MTAIPSGSPSSGTSNLERRLAHYSSRRPGEVLLISAEIAGEWDQIAIYKGFASSLMRPTAFDPDVPVLPEEAVIQQIDRVASPYQPNQPRYIQQGMSWAEFQALLAEVGV
jgi:hypothetical protein